MVPNASPSPEQPRDDVAQLLFDAEARARRIVADAESNGAAIIEAARTQACFEARRMREESVTDARAVTLRVPPTTTPLHSSEITLREFPRAVHGFDREAVSRWLAFVESSYTLVEDELERRRCEMNELMDALGDLRLHLAVTTGGRVDADTTPAKAAWKRVLDVAASTIPSPRLAFDTLLVRTALMEAPLRRTFAGFARDQVRGLLEASAAQLARLENQLQLAHADNARLLSRYLEQIAQLEPADRGQGGKVPGAIRPLRAPSRGV